jgi:dTDP-4-dehydrorhamnose reductase
MKLRVLLTGKNGQVGSELVRCLHGTTELTATGRSELDLAEPAEIRRVIAQSRPELIINAAAYTAVDQTEKEEPLAHAINARAPGVIAEEAAKIGAFLIHFSTDYVFDGAKRFPYLEDDPTNPLSAYGRTKLAGEEAVCAAGVPYLILRTAWIYANSGRNFLLTILRLASTREELRIVNDQYGAPTSARAIARAIAGLLERRDSVESLAQRSGIYHLTAAGETTWYDFARAIVDGTQAIARHSAEASTAWPPWLSAATGGRALIARRIVPIKTAEYPTPAQRPAYSVLSNARFAATFGFALPHWHTQLADVLSTGE